MGEEKKVLKIYISKIYIKYIYNLYIYISITGSCILFISFLFFFLNTLLYLFIRLCWVFAAVQAFI